MENYKVTDELAEIILPGHNELLAEHLRMVEMTKAQYLEKMVATFAIEVGIPVSQCELVQQQLEHPSVGWRFYFRRRA